MSIEFEPIHSGGFDSHSIGDTNSYPSPGSSAQTPLSWQQSQITNLDQNCFETPSQNFENLSQSGR